MNSHSRQSSNRPKKTPLYLPQNGIALVEIDTDTDNGTVQPIKIHEIYFSERLYSNRKEFAVEAKAVDKTFLSPEQQQKIIKLSQEICFSRASQSEPTESLKTDYFLGIRFVPLGKQDFLECELYFNKCLEKKGKFRDIFDQIKHLEKIAAEPR